MSAPKIRRIVTGHDSEGLSVITTDEVRQGPSAFVTLLWTTDTSPVDNSESADGADRVVGATLEGGTVFRIGTLDPGHRSPMHRTVSLDYGIVLQGKLVLELDGGEVVNLDAGDVVVQRGTNHIWANESDEPCVVAFVLMDAEPLTVNGRVLEPTPIVLPEPDRD